VIPGLAPWVKDRGTYTIKALKTLDYMYYPVNAFQVKLNLLACGREREREREKSLLESEKGY